MADIHPLLELFANRRTVRAYKLQPLSESDLQHISEAGQRAPTGGLSQIYSVVRITDAQMRDRLATLCGNQQHIRDAAEFFVFCVDVYRARRLLEHRAGSYGAGPGIAAHYGTMDALLVAANMTTAAEALGYGTCYIGAILNHLDTVARELQLPQGVLPVVGLTVGVPDLDQPLPPTPRLPSELVFHENAYREPTPADLDAAYCAMGDAWFDTLQRYFGPARTFSQREEVWLRTLVQQGFIIDEGKNE